MQLHHWKEVKRKVKHMRVDDIGEKEKLNTRSDNADWKLNIVCHVRHHLAAQNVLPEEITRSRSGN
jgi:hypothetical protein